MTYKLTKNIWLSIGAISILTMVTPSFLLADWTINSDFSPAGVRPTLIVKDMVTFNDKVYIAGHDFSGRFRRTEGGYETGVIAKWNPQTRDWETIGTATFQNDHGKSFDASVEGLAVVNNPVTKVDELVVVGSFSHISFQEKNLPASYVARWDGTTWVQFETKELPYRFYDLNLIESFDGTFVVANRQQIFKWDWQNSSWEQFLYVNEDNGSILDLAVSKKDTGSDRLIVGGFFSHINKADVETEGVAYFENGTWHGVGDVSKDWRKRKNVYVYSVLGRKDEIYVGGLFNQMGGKDAKNIAHWDGNQWNAVGKGADNSVSNLTIVDGAPDRNSYLVVGSNFSNTPKGGLIQKSWLATWNLDKEEWEKFSPIIQGWKVKNSLDSLWPTEVNSILPYENGFLVGGKFTGFWEPGDNFNFTGSPNLIRFDYQ